MDADERQIFDYLKSWPRHFVSAREVCVRTGGKRRYREDPRWALPILSRLLEEGLIETDSPGHYRVKPADARNKKRRRWVSPHIAKILRASGRDFDGVSVTDLDAFDDT